MKNIPQAYRPSYLWFWPPLILRGSVISTRSQAGKSTGYRPTLKPLHSLSFCTENSIQNLIKKFIYYPVTIWLPLLMMQPLFDPISKLRWEVFVRLVEIIDHHRFKPPSGQHKSYKIGTTCICCLSSLH